MNDEQQNVTLTAEASWAGWANCGILECIPILLQTKTLRFQNIQIFLRKLKMANDSYFCSLINVQPSSYHRQVLQKLYETFIPQK